MSWARRLGRQWALWIAVAVPLAQAAAVLHELGHYSPGAGSAASAGVASSVAAGVATSATAATLAAAAPRDGHTVHVQAPCELCLAAAALGAAVPPAAPGLGLRAAAAPAPAPSCVLPQRPAPLICAYHSRAPPPLRIDR